MGMYDHLLINKELLPITQEEKDKISEGEVYQTKNFDNAMDKYEILDNGDLKVTRATWYKDDKQVDTEIIPYHGIINFYTYIGAPNSYKDEEWFEFQAKFTDGKLVEIRRFKED